MTLEQVFLRFSRIASLPLLVIALLFCYFSLPDNVAIHHNNFGKPDGFVGKETFYYVMVAIILAFNVVMTSLKNAFLKLPNSAFQQQNSWTKDRAALNLLAETWVNLFITIINVFLLISIIALNRINRNEGQILDINYNWVLLLGGVLLMLIIFYLPLKLLYTKPEIEV
jgi:Protein of unknown function (DUF1648)